MIFLDMVRNGERCAEVAVFSSGRCVVSWPTSTVVYDSLEAARAVHIDHMGGRGEETRFELSVAAPDVLRGWTEAIQDDCEGISLCAARVPGFEGTVRAPGYIEEDDRAAWELGYAASLTCSSYGSRWREPAKLDGVAVPSFKHWEYLTDAQEAPQ